MELDPQTIEAYKECLNNPAKYNLKMQPFKDYFVQSENITALHVLAKDFQENVNRNVTKFIIYLLLQDHFGNPNGKDTEGFGGYNLAFSKDCELSKATHYSDAQQFYKNNNLPLLCIWDNEKLVAQNIVEAKDFFHKVKSTFFSVCGWSKKHKYYRTKVGTFATEEEAMDCLKEYRNNPEWVGVSTIIVKEMFYKSVTIENIGCSDLQQRIWACSCKNANSKIYKQSDYGRFTY